MPMFIELTNGSHVRLSYFSSQILLYQFAKQQSVQLDVPNFRFKIFLAIHQAFIHN